ncbi:MAG: hypothetical protein GX957_02460, partial [Clostridiaceae bacterium]|nr:hypothetical protein [Clostridiaceae bacterium]
ENDYFVSFDESTEIRNLEPMFDKSALSELIKQDNNSVTEPVIVDINHGQDFIVFYEVDGNQKCIPFFTNSGMFGLKNATVYERVRMFRIISQHIQ